MSGIVLIDAAGPLPITVQFDAPADGPVMFMMSGTAWTQSAPCLTSIQLILDGQNIGSPALCFANQNANHQALRTTTASVDNLSFATHTLEIVAGDNTITDGNDYFQVVMYY